MIDINSITSYLEKNIFVQNVLKPSVCLQNALNRPFIGKLGNIYLLFACGCTDFNHFGHINEKTKQKTK